MATSRKISEDAISSDPSPGVTEKATRMGHDIEEIDATLV